MPSAPERTSSESTKSQQATKPVNAAVSRTVGDDLVQVALQQKLQLDSITVNGASLSEVSIQERTSHPDCKPISRCVAELLSVYLDRYGVFFNVSDEKNSQQDLFVI